MKPNVTDEKRLPLPQYNSMTLNNRFIFQFEEYEPDQVAHLRPHEIALLPKTSSIVWMADSLFGADLKVTKQTLNKHLEQLFIRGQRHWRMKKFLIEAIVMVTEIAISVAVGYWLGASSVFP